MASTETGPEQQKGHSFRGQEAVAVELVAESTNPLTDETVCWVCHARRHEDMKALWVHPCDCSGSTEWVHERCLRRYIHSELKGNLLNKVKCPICSATYILAFKNIGLFHRLDMGFQKVLQKTGPYIFAGVRVLGFYDLVCTLGHLLLLVAMGEDNGKAFMMDAHFLTKRVVMPFATLLIVAFEVLPWEQLLSANQVPIHALENAILNLHFNKMKIFWIIFNIWNFAAATNLICRKLLSNLMVSNILCTLLGGLITLSVKAVLRICYRMHVLSRKSTTTWRICNKPRSKLLVNKC